MIDVLWAIGAVVLVGGAVGIVTFFVGLNRAAKAATAGPTPEQTKAQVQKAEAPVIAATAAAEKEIHDATLLQNIDRARDIAGRGKLPR